jgi:RNA polymerase sigma-70 factor (ECF subfamily)
MDEPRDDASRDFVLVERCQNGDMGAYSELVNLYQRRVYSIAFSMLKNADDAMDVAQDAFVKVYRYINNFKGTSSFYTWLYRIVVNLCIDHMRRAGKMGNAEFDEKFHDRFIDESAGTVMSTGLNNHPGKNVSRKELANLIDAAIGELPPYHRAVIVMREVEGMSYTDMARALKVSKGTIMSRLHHARQKLQRILGDYVSDELNIT